MDDARRAILRWSAEGRLPAERLDDALRIAGVTPAGAQWRAFVERTLAWLAAAALAASLLFFVAANWQALGRFGKFALVEGALVAALAVTWWRGLDSLVGRAALFAAALATGVLLALVGQVYQTGADTFELFVAWAAAIAVWVAVSRQPALWLLWIAIVDVAIVLWFRVEAERGLGLVELLFVPRPALWGVFALDAVALASWEWLAGTRGGWLAVRWAPRVLAAAAGAVITLLVAHDVLLRDRGDLAWSWAPYALWIGGLWWAYRVRTRELFMLAGMVASLIAVAAVAIGRPALDSGDAGGFLVLGLLLVACGGAGAWWLRRVAAEAGDAA